MTTSCSRVIFETRQRPEPRASVDVRIPVADPSDAGTPPRRRSRRSCCAGSAPSTRD